MVYGINILMVAKYITLICIFIGIFLAPVLLACANDRSKYDMMRTRFGSWMFGWSFIGWLFALFVSSKK